MKTLSNIITTVKDGKLTLTADIIEKEFSTMLVRRITIGHLNPDNMRHMRHIQVSDEAVFVKLPSTKFGVAIEREDLIKIATAVEPKTSFVPIFKKSKEPLTVEISSELSPDFQWQVADNLKAPEWKNIDGQTTKSLDQSKVKSGQFVRCVASSEAGSMNSNPIAIK